MSSHGKRSATVLPLLLALLAAPRPAPCAQEDDGDGEDEGPLNPYDAAPLADPALRTHGWIALFTGAGLLAAGAVTGGIALHLDADLEGDCPGGSCPPSRQGDIEARDALAVSSTVLIGAGFCCSMMGILILAVFAADIDPDAPADEAGEQARLAPRLLPGPGTLALEVRF